MPKEVVYGLPAPYHKDNDVVQPVVVLSWSKETGDVQLVTRELHHEIHSVEDDHIPCQYGYYASLNRAAINDLIRNLRRARDQAFGRDE